MNILLRVFIAAVILTGGFGVMMLLIGSKKEPTFKRPDREPPTVEVIILERQPFKVTITAHGVVHARNTTSLTPRVSGRVLRIPENFEPGAFFKEGEVLLELDPADFEAAVASAEAQLARSQSDLVQEQARSQQALLDWQDLGYTEPPSDLVLRKPQMKEAEANVKAAEAQLLRAQRDLERAQVLAPYDGCVRTRTVGLGQSVNPGTTLGEIFSTDYAEIRLPLSTNDLPFINLPEELQGTPLNATITDALKPVEGRSWNAQVIRTEGVLDDTSRELFVNARVADPYGLTEPHTPLRVGQPVQAEITGKILEDVFVIPRTSLRSPNEVVLINPEESTVERTTISPIWSNDNEVIVRHDLPEGWYLVTSDLRIAANGSKVNPILPGETPEDEKAAKTPEEDTEA